MRGDGVSPAETRTPWCPAALKPESHCADTHGWCAADEAARSFKPAVLRRDSSRRDGITRALSAFVFRVWTEAAWNQEQSPSKAGTYRVVEPGVEVARVASTSENVFIGAGS